MQNYDLTDDELQLASLVREFADEVVAPRHLGDDIGGGTRAGSGGAGGVLPARLPLAGGVGEGAAHPVSEKTSARSRKRRVMQGMAVFLMWKIESSFPLSRE